MLRILLCEESEASPHPVGDLLEQLGHTVAGRIDVPGELAEHARRIAPDAIVVVTRAPRGAALAALGSVSRSTPRPILIFTDDSDCDSVAAAVRCGASAYVVGALSCERVAAALAAAVARFEQLRSLRMEIAAARAQLEERKLVERAKGILMKRRKLSEEDAYRALRKQAMDRKQKLTEVARQVIAVADLLS